MCCSVLQCVAVRCYYCGICEVFYSGVCRVTRRMKQTNEADESTPDLPGVIRVFESLMYSNDVVGCQKVFCIRLWGMVCIF